MTVSQKLRLSLQQIGEKLYELIRSMPIEQQHHSPGMVGFPNHYWGEADNKQRKLQIDIKREFNEWIELLKIILRSSPDQISRKIESAEQKLRRWIELKSSHDIGENSAHNEQKIQEALAQFYPLLDILDSGNSEVILIPDTNSLIRKPDPTEYRTIIGAEKFTFLLLPSILSELDKLKTSHRDNEFREKVARVVTRIKGWREQGSLSSGVTVDNSITVKAVHNDPDMQSTLSWLDNTIIDDRIIASVIEVESNFPACRVVLATGDINLQNKADAAKIECVDV